MKAEKIQKEQTSRTIQPMRKGGGTAQFADNRNIAQFTSSEDEEESLQLKKDSAIQRKPNNTGLPDNLKTGVENLSGLSMDDVRVHYNSSKPAAVQALAYTQGTDIHVAPGQEQHLPHEAWHVVQQMQGRVQPTTEVGGMPVNNDVGLEREADAMGGKSYSLSEQKQTIQNKNIGSNIVQYVKSNKVNYNEMKDMLELETDVPVYYLKDVNIQEKKGKIYPELASGATLTSATEIKVALRQGNNYEKLQGIMDLGGGGFDPVLKCIFITNTSRGFERTLFHEMGHFKQFQRLRKKNFGQLSRVFREAHNIIVNENKNTLLYPPDNQLNTYIKYYKGEEEHYIRVYNDNEIILSKKENGQSKTEVMDKISKGLPPFQKILYDEMLRTIEEESEDKIGEAMGDRNNGNQINILIALRNFLGKALEEQNKSNQIK